jgi:hypothetical protein
MCNRNLIVVTPNKHFSSFGNIDDNFIGKIFKSIHNFCIDWDIKDYSVSYNQGEWQTHNHFHLKIKTQDSKIKSMRNAHFSRLKMISERMKNK